MNEVWVSCNPNVSMPFWMIVKGCKGLLLYWFPKFVSEYWNKAWLILIWMWVWSRDCGRHGLLFFRLYQLDGPQDVQFQRRAKGQRDNSYYWWSLWFDGSVTWMNQFVFLDLRERSTFDKWHIPLSLACLVKRLCILYVLFSSPKWSLWFTVCSV